jgi:hypothetical protein
MATGSSVCKIFEQGGIITITDAVGPVTTTILLVKEGTLEWEPGGYTPGELTDRGILQDPYELSETPTKLKFQVYFTGTTSATDLYKILVAAGVSGKMKQFSIVVKIPNTKGAGAGDQITFAKCWRPKGALKVKHGTEFDYLEVELVDNEVTPACVTY